MMELLAPEVDVLIVLLVFVCFSQKLRAGGAEVSLPFFQTGCHLCLQSRIFRGCIPRGKKVTLLPVLLDSIGGGTWRHPKRLPYVIGQHQVEGRSTMFL